MASTRPALALVAPASPDVRVCSKCGRDGVEFTSKRGHICIECNEARIKQWQKDNPERIREASRRFHSTEHGKAYRREQQNTRRQTHPHEALFFSARQRAVRDGVAFTITKADILIPPCCPVLGIPLERRIGAKGPQDNSPSIDRIDPALGYTPTNIAVISIRANRIKNDASVEELERVLAWVRAARRRR